MVHKQIVSGSNQLIVSICIPNKMGRNAMAAPLYQHLLFNVSDVYTEIAHFNSILKTFKFNYVTYKRLGGQLTLSRPL